MAAASICRRGGPAVRSRLRDDIPTVQYNSVLSLSRPELTVREARCIQGSASTDASMASRFAWVARFRSRRLWLIILGTVLLLRVALPYALRPILASQASKAINARVDIGDVDLALYRAGIA